MRRSAALLAVACLLAGAGCSKDADQSAGAKGAGGEAKTATDPSADNAKVGAEGAAGGAAAEAVDPVAVAAKIGVEPGPIEYDADEGAAAVVSGAEGKVEVRRIGTENWQETKAEAQLHEGDQVRAAEGGLVTITLVDETAIEIAEESAVAIGSRKATEDPASSAAVLYGVARFSVSERGAGEGPFLAFTPGGVVATKGTVYTVGVAASGATRVGVESGEVEVAGSARLDAPVAVVAGKAVVVAPAGEVGEVEALGDGDWGAWRDGAEADLDPKAAAEFHAHRAEALEAELEATYAELEAQTEAAAAAEAKVEAAAEANDTAAYEAAAPELGGAVDASFAMSLRLQYLSNAMLADAYVADALYLRHPDLVAVIEPARPRFAAAVLWHKKYHAVADLHIEPLRVYYYDHHPIGRVNARLVGHPIPAFYGRVKLDYRVPVVTSRMKFYRPPVMHASVRVKKVVYVRAPRLGWYASVRGRVRPAPARVRWYVRPKAPRARVVFGARPSGSVKIKAVFGAAPARPRAKAVVRFGGKAGVDVRDHRRAVEVRDHRGGVDVRDHRGGAVKVGGGGVKVRGAAGVRAVEVRERGGGEVQAKARVKVKAPKVKVRAPKVKGSIKVRGGIKIGK